VGLNAVGDGDQHRAQADGEGDVAPPVDARGVALAVVAQLQVCPDGAVDADRHVDPEHPAPVDGGQQATRDQPDEHAGQARDLVRAEREATLLGREGVGQDRGRVRHQHGPADGLQQAPADQP
jgi:hypothetical protein